MSNLLTIRWSTMVFVVLFAQLVTLVTLASGLLSIGAAATGTISYLPPFTFLYSDDATAWIGAGRAIGHIITAIMHGLIGVFCVWYAIGRRLKIIKWVMMMLGIHMFFVAVVDITITGTITYGGWWHVSSFIAILISTITSTAAAIVFIVVQKQLRLLGQAYDAHIDNSHSEMF